MFDWILKTPLNEKTKSFKRSETDTLRSLLSEAIAQGCSMKKAYDFMKLRDVSLQLWPRCFSMNFVKPLTSFVCILSFKSFTEAYVLDNLVHISLNCFDKGLNT